jgi:2-dehydro-3-deoxyglucarate aldolase/4-hydroxy-2-oxoheptanedioate aldolase
VKDVTKRTLRARAIAGETVLGVMVFEFFVPGIPQILSQTGAEYAIYDMEHGGLNLETLKMLAAASRGTNVAPLVRVPRGEYHFIARALDVGAHGVMVPMVESAVQAREIAQAARYPRQGRRGAAFGFAHDDYAPGDAKDKMRVADHRNMVIAQIETERGLAAVEEIAATEGIDCLWLGHFDMTNFSGIAGQFEHPEYLAAVESIVAAGRRNRKALGFMAADVAWATKYRKHGFNMIATGTDQGILIAGIRTILQSVGDM